MAKRIYHIHLWRRISQFFFLFALNPYFFVFRGFCFPAMNCWACPAAAFGCPVGGIAYLAAHGFFAFLTIGILLVVGALVGRLICGWVCPFGLLQDLMNRIPSKKLKLPPAFSYLKYVVLVVMVLGVPYFMGTDALGSEEGPGSPAFFCTYCPAGTLEAAIPAQFGWKSRSAQAPEEVADAGEEGEEGEEHDPAEEENADADGGEMDPFGGGDLFGEDEGDEEEGTAWLSKGMQAIVGGVEENKIRDFFLKSPRMWVLYAFLLLFVLIRRPFCRAVCPIGAVFAVFNRISLLRLRVQEARCKGCNLCAKNCPVDNKVNCSPSSDDCIRCLECLDSCKRGCTKAGLIALRPRDGYWE